MHPYQAGGNNNLSSGNASTNIPQVTSPTQSNLRQGYSQQVPSQNVTSNSYYQRNTPSNVAPNLLPHLSYGGILPPRTFVGTSPLTGVPPPNYGSQPKQYQQAQPSNQRLGFRNDQPQQLDPKQLQKISSPYQQSPQSSSSPPPPQQQQSYYQQSSQNYSQNSSQHPQGQQTRELSSPGNSNNQVHSSSSTQEDNHKQRKSNDHKNTHKSQVVPKIVDQTDPSTGKKKRGRPKKFILDPSTNTMIDSTHPNFKQLNKALKDGNIDQDVRSNGSSTTISDMSVLLNSSGTVDGFNDLELKELLKKKDRRGRPRKFTVEETGVTIKGVRINGSSISKTKN
ncbi:conserved hypothetical protein [Candida dubliniensis CD36]|uniref:Uncharacterized protein n=1 Tax=Candida dubliniensis (strain CD36 / ATCC MYA-646 / CBS 7987 / NCPF 3949 / NRRL Y-17841) TaxID=573826 RepID=B9WA00_CANDC|nr:conserved hypothetical protein [Candida dubliniensis CD36]CAX45638.1 conserved hypothetical protein [Candida dubliniensis CD36]